MPQIIWSDNLSVGVAEIDEQHKGLVNLINELYEAMKVGKAKWLVGGIIDSLVDYTVQHFATEEKYFDKFSYPDAAEHIAQHQKFVAQVAEFQQNFKDGQVLLSVDILTFLKDWLITHIKGSDKNFSKCFQDNGLK